GEHRGPERGDPVLHRLLRSAPERHHGDHRGDADDDAQHREQRAELVRAQRLERHRDCLEDRHVRSPPRSTPAPAAATTTTTAVVRKDGHVSPPPAPPPAPAAATTTTTAAAATATAASADAARHRAH